ncbi:MAG: hypothetical protein MUF40_05305 [Gemmatimonadaceae bacterium]|nr:hypothetical protein [Gemmatimonadaceae bacterium]
MPLAAQPGAGAVRLDTGRFTIVHHPADARLAATLARAAVGRDTFPGLPRPRGRVLIMVAPDAATFRRWVGPFAPEWGAAVAFPAESRVVVQGSAAPSSAGDPRTILRHELAHLALHEHLGDKAPRWFDEGYAQYAAGEVGERGYLETNLALLFRRMPTFAGLDSAFATRSSVGAAAAYRLAAIAVAHLADRDRANGLTLLFRYWAGSDRLDGAVRRAYGTTLDAVERDWQRRARWEAGALALAADLSLVGLLALVPLVPLWRQRRRRQQARLAAMREEEARLEAAMAASALDALLAPTGGAVRPAWAPRTES